MKIQLPLALATMLTTTLPSLAATGSVTWEKGYQFNARNSQGEEHSFSYVDLTPTDIAEYRRLARDGGDYADFFDRHLDASPIFGNTDILLESTVTPVNANWNISTAGTFTLGGNGTVDFSGEGGLYLTTWDAYTGTTYDASFVIDSGITLRNGELASEYPTPAVEIIVKGTLENVEVSALNNRLDLTEATLRGTFRLFLQPESTTRVKDFTIDASRSVFAYGKSSQSDGNARPVIQGDVLLAGGAPLIAGETLVGGYPQGGIVMTAVSDGTPIEIERGDTFYNTIAIDGTLKALSPTAVYFYHQDYAYSDVTPTYSAPGDGYLLAVCNQLEGSVDNLRPYLVKNEIDPGEFSYNYGRGDVWIVPLESMRFVAVQQLDSTVGIMLVNGQAPDAPGDALLVGSGETVSPDNLDRPLYLTGGTADLTGISAERPLDGSMISGSSGTIVASTTQIIQLDGIRELLYDMLGPSDAEGKNQPGAALRIGNADEPFESTFIWLEGSFYTPISASVASGTLSIGKGAIVTLGGSEESRLIVAPIVQPLEHADEESLLASVTNEGTIQGDVLLNRRGSLLNNGLIKGDIDVSGTLDNLGTVDGLVTVRENGQVCGSGRFDSVHLEKHGTLIVGNSPGYQNIQSLTLDGDSNVRFFIDGPRAATLDDHGEGTYSRMEVDSLTLNGAPQMTISIGAHVAAAGSSIACELISVGNSVTGETYLDSISVNLDDPYHLIETEENSSSVVWDKTEKTLSFTGKINRNAAASLARSDAALMADTLWSNVSTVASFAQTALSQLNGQRSQFWVSGLGNFTTMANHAAGSGFSYDGGGYAVGGDLALGENASLGIAVGQTFGRHKSNDHALSDRQEALMAALYGRYRHAFNPKHALEISGALACGRIDNDARAHVGGPASGVGSRAAWDAAVAACDLQVSWDIAYSRSLTLSPFAGLRYAHGAQDDFAEEFDGGSRLFQDGSMQVWSLPVGLTVRGYLPWGAQALAPELTVAYIGDIQRRNPRIHTQAAGNDVTAWGHNPGRSAFMSRAALTWKITENWSSGAAYVLEARSGQTNQSVQIHVNYEF